MTKGKVVASIPPRGRGPEPMDWDTPAKLAKLSGQPVLAAEDVRNSRVKSVRMYKRPPFVTAEGRIIIKLRNSQVKADGERYGDVYFEWEPTTTTKESK